MVDVLLLNKISTVETPPDGAQERRLLNVVEFIRVNTVNAGRVTLLAMLSRVFAADAEFMSVWHASRRLKNGT